MVNQNTMSEFKEVYVSSKRTFEDKAVQATRNFKSKVSQATHADEFYVDTAVSPRGGPLVDLGIQVKAKTRDKIC